MSTEDKYDIEEKDEAKPLQEVDDERMSRGLEPEYSDRVNFSKFENLFVYDEQGNKIRFGDVYKRQKTILVFTRHFLDFACKEYVEDLGIVPLEYLQEAEVRIVVIGPAPFKHIREFKKETGYHYTLYCDPDREIYKALELKEGNVIGPVGASKHVKTGYLQGFFSGMWKIMRIQTWLGNTKQQGGSFIFGPGNIVHYAHKDENNVDHTAINELLTRAGVRSVSFPKDPRVQNV